MFWFEGLPHLIHISCLPNYGECFDLRNPLYFLFLFLIINWPIICMYTKLSANEHNSQAYALINIWLRYNYIRCVRVPCACTFWIAKLTSIQCKSIMTHEPNEVSAFLLISITHSSSSSIALLFVIANMS